LLDSHEGGYRKVPITVSVGHEFLKEMKAVAYIAGPDDKATGAFTLTMVDPPSEQYLWAIYGNLREHWIVDSIVVRSYEPKRGPFEVMEWIRPKSPKLLSLQALCVEISLNHAVHWEMPKTIDVFVDKLEQIDISTTDQLITALKKKNLNKKLTKKGLTQFHPETLEVMKSLLL
jgi:hypothetical protein